jgi:hypothetical protein
MKMRFTVLGLIFIFFFCQNQIEEEIMIENEINLKINENLKLNNENLMEEINNLYLQDVKLKKHYIQNEHYNNIIALLDEIQDQGSFCIIDSTLLKETRKLRNKLDLINFFSTENLNFKFLYNIYNPVIQNHKQYYTTKKSGTKDIIYNVGTIHPDSANVSYTLFLIVLKEYINKEKLNDQTYLNTILLLTYGNLIYFSTGKNYP